MFAVPTTSNAAGNTNNFLDLMDENAQQSFLPNSFTARGIVALVSSSISALLSVIFIVVYSLSDRKFYNKEVAEVAIAISDVIKDTMQAAVGGDIRISLEGF